MSFNVYLPMSVRPATAFGSMTGCSLRPADAGDCLRAATLPAPPETHDALREGPLSALLRCSSRAPCSAFLRRGRWADHSPSSGSIGDAGIPILSRGDGIHRRRSVRCGHGNVQAPIVSVSFAPLRARTGSDIHHDILKLSNLDVFRRISTVMTVGSRSLDRWFVRQARAGCAP